MTPNAEIGQCLKGIHEARQVLADASQLGSAFHQEYFAELIAWFLSIPHTPYMRKKYAKNPEKARLAAWGLLDKSPELHPEGVAIEEKWCAKAKEYTAANRARIDLLEKRIAELVTVAALSDERTETVWTTYRWYYGGAYSSQGWGAERYLNASIENDKDILRTHIADDDMKVETSPGGKTLFVRYTEIGVAILKNLPPPEFRTLIKNMLKRGVNPRVYYPFLPHGYEAKVGLDYFGNDVTK